MVNPRKRLILCIDGVAGSAKMSQQRQRRFKSAKITQEGEKSEDFDSNCITPGTFFMDKLSKYIDWYIRVMVSHSPEWANIEIIFSNEKAEGEGEHKIIKFIRNHIKDESESFCIHGLDADLIMLALGTNLTNIFILRENMRGTFLNVLNIGKFRGELEDHMKWEEGDCRYLKSSGVNDFILLCFLVGNDFLPTIPSLAILEGGIDIMIDTYKSITPTYGHLIRKDKNGKFVLRPKSMEAFLGTLSQNEVGLLTEKQNKQSSFFEDVLLNKHTSIDGGKKVVNFENYRNEFNNTKFPDTDIKDICHLYLEGMEWVINYYKVGIPSWSWYYPYHYAPLAYDMARSTRNYKSKKLEQGQSIPPFQQLLSVLPPQSANLLPDPLNKLLISGSEISKYCPDDFEVDLSGKRREWEGIVLIPMIKSDILQREYSENIKKVSCNESRRNIKGKSFLYKYDKDYIFPVFKSYYGNIRNCKAVLSHFYL